MPYRPALLLACLSLLALGCRRAEPPPVPPAPPVAPRSGQLPPAPVPALPQVRFAPGSVQGQPPPGAPPLEQAIARVLQAVRGDKVEGLEPLLAEAALRRLRPGKVGGQLPITAGSVRQRLQGTPSLVRYDGGRATVLYARGKDTQPAYFYLVGGQWRFDVTDNRPWSEPATGPQDPLNRDLTLPEATAGLTGEGALWATLDTTAGPIRCRLHERETPRTVAHFVGLARGLRASLVPAAKGAPAFGKRRFYDDTPFHRVQPGVQIQGGDPDGSGRGNAGFQIADELDLRLRHDRPGVLGLANAGPNTGSGQFYVTEKPAPWLDDRQTVFGVCQDLEVVAQIARASAGSVRVRRVEVSRRP